MKFGWGAKSNCYTGVTFKTGAILAVNSVAVSDLNENSVYQGNPATFKRKRGIANEKSVNHWSYWARWILLWAEFLLDKGYEVHGIKRRASSFNTERVDHIYQDRHNQNPNFFLHYGDLTDTSNLIRLIKEIQPDEVYNLGAPISCSGFIRIT